MKYTRIREIIPICLICGAISGYAGYQAARPSHVTAPTSVPVTKALERGTHPHHGPIHDYVIGLEGQHQSMEVYTDDPRIIAFQHFVRFGRVRCADARETCGGVTSGGSATND